MVVSSRIRPFVYCQQPESDRPGLLAVTATAAVTAELGLYALLESLELRAEFAEKRVVDILLYHMVHEPHGKHKLLGVLILCK